MQRVYGTARARERKGLLGGLFGLYSKAFVPESCVFPVTIRIRISNDSHQDIGTIRIRI
jgi:hypothetical protein